MDDLIRLKVENEYLKEQNEELKNAIKCRMVGDRIPKRDNEPSQRPWSRKKKRQPKSGQRRKIEKI